MTSAERILAELHRIRLAVLRVEGRLERVEGKVDRIAAIAGSAAWQQRGGDAA